MKLNPTLIFTCWWFLFSFVGAAQEAEEKSNWNEEIIYHVMPRSFYDSNGDLHGDLQGFTEKLPYLKELGVTTILFTPLYESDFYHNYFPTDYEKIDPEFGNMDDYIAFVKAVHSEGLKFLMDMETQYAQNGHKWFEDSYKNPESPFTDYIYYDDSLNLYPYQIFVPPGDPLVDFEAWPEQELNIVYLNMNNPEVKDYMIDFYSFWVDPNQDGNFDDGVDGFRIDHIMDDLDYLGVFTNLYEDFWSPVFSAAKDINPDLFIVGEQSDWTSYGEEMMESSGADASFGFHLRYAIAGTAATYMGGEDDQQEGEELTSNKIIDAVTNTLERIPEDKYFINFLENHDITRWASEVNSDVRKLKAGAVLNLTLPGIPSIYYGQELGVTGKVRDWGYDVNHLPVREAFPWTPEADFPGTAVFFKGTGPWWDESFFNTDAVKELALSTQRENEESLWHHYRDLISLRKEHKAFSRGDFQPLQMENKKLLAFQRNWNEEIITVFMNLSEEQRISLKDEKPNLNGAKVLYSSAGDTNQLTLEPFGYLILRSDGN